MTRSKRPLRMMAESNFSTWFVATKKRMPRPPSCSLWNAGNMDVVSKRENDSSATPSRSRNNSSISSKKTMVSFINSSSKKAKSRRLETP